MSSATAIVHSGGLFWLNPVAMVLFMLCILCSAVLCCRVIAVEAEMCGILIVMYGSSVFSGVLISLREVGWFCMMTYVHIFVWVWNWYDVC